MALAPWIPPGPTGTPTARQAQCPRCGTKWWDLASTSSQCTNCGGPNGGGAWVTIPT